LNRQGKKDKTKTGIANFITPESDTKQLSKTSQIGTKPFWITYQLQLTLKNLPTLLWIQWHLKNSKPKIN